MRSLALLCLLSACGGVTQSLGDAPGAGGSSAAVLSSHPCETECVLATFTRPTGCKLCHSNVPEPDGLQSSGLDLASANVTARLKDVAAQHRDLPPSANPSCPTNDLLIDSDNVERSWLLRKIRGQQGTCGDAMPPVPIEPGALQCLETYVYCVVASD